MKGLMKSNLTSKENIAKAKAEHKISEICQKGKSMPRVKLLTATPRVTA